MGGILGVILGGVGSRVVSRMGSRVGSQVGSRVGSWPRPEFRLEAPQISFINLPDSGPNLQKIRLKIPVCS